VSVSAAFPLFGKGLSTPLLGESLCRRPRVKFGVPTHSFTRTHVFELEGFGERPKTQVPSAPPQTRPGAVQRCSITDDGRSGHENHPNAKVLPSHLSSAPTPQPTS